MKELTINDIKEIPEKVYVRWSQSIKLDNDRGYSLAYGSSREAGLSACEIGKDWSDWRIIRQLREYIFCGGSCWIITGDEVGTGQDNEPLLTNVKLVGKVSDNVLSIDWEALERQENIANLQARITRVTDPIGKQILQDALNRQRSPK